MNKRITQYIIALLLVFLTSSFYGYGQYIKIGSWNLKNAGNVNYNSKLNQNTIFKHGFLFEEIIKAIIDQNKMSMLFVQELQTDLNYVPKNLSFVQTPKYEGLKWRGLSPRIYKRDTSFYIRRFGNNERYGVYYYDLIQDPIRDNYKKNLTIKLK